MGKFKNLKQNQEIKTHRAAFKHAGGRPKIEESKRKKEKVFVSFTTQEKEKLKALAEKEGLPIATFIRKILKENGVI